MLRRLALALATAASLTVPCTGAVTNETQGRRTGHGRAAPYVHGECRYAVLLPVNNALPFPLVIAHSRPLPRVFPLALGVHGWVTALRSMAAQWQAGTALASWQVDDVCAVAGGATGITCQDGSVTALSLNRTNMSLGPLPAEIGVLTALTLLSVRASFSFNHQLLPSTISRCRPTMFHPTSSSLSLRHLIQSLSRTNLSGPLPVEIGDLTALTLLDLSYNSLNNTIPSSISNLARLKSL
ncbi:unnamed protein product [Closterium sp. Naga37s-1]|nr:unnamed protein product [Closterium sp. Naga37s-1]